MKDREDSVFQEAMDGVAPLKEGVGNTTPRPRASPTAGQLQRRRDAETERNEKDDRNPLTLGPRKISCRGDTRCTPADLERSS